MSKDPYQILKVHPSAKLEEIKKAYRKLVKIHQDKITKKSQCFIIIEKMTKIWPIFCALKSTWKRT